MTIQELRMKMMKTKKTDPSLSKAYQAILGTAQLIAKNDGNREANNKDIIAAAKKELKMAKQSRDSGAPYNETIFAVSNEFLPKMMNEMETRITIETMIYKLPEKSLKHMGKIMKELSSQYGEVLDKKLASDIVKELLS